ncbi:MAG: RdgB/HAM1 family non-canonical purine NTP pyrophosphatase [Alphaproteobacteria bacterium]|nr:RdgB/HAM1 family non-canonical purine NTP pyrophosphatase [Alphaproteobacteria bacterium]
MHSIIFASSNHHKMHEIQSILKQRIDIKSLKDLHDNQDIPEPYFTLEENALIKAKTIYDRYNQAVFSEDTGLFIDALHGEPGVKSARYALTKKSTLNNVDLVLDLLKNKTHRTAYFKTVICCILPQQTAYFTGYTFGHISSEIKGNSGFGYDGIFTPNTSDKTFAEMDLDSKNSFSHRRQAVDKFAVYLKNVKCID